METIYDRLTPEQEALLEVTIYDNPYIPHEPFEKQVEFLLLDCEEAMYGGQAGGGKSDALLMAALQYVEVPEYAALILRRSYKDLSLPGALMDRSHAWLRHTDAHWNNIDHTWTFPSGATLTFGHLQHNNSMYQYQGSELQFVAFDELTQFTEQMYLYLFSRTRRLEGSAIPIRIRSASNPGGLGHQWVRQRFIFEGEEKGRPFIPSSFRENPYIDRNQYEKALDKLDWITRRQLKHGDWYANPFGGLFLREWFEKVKPIGQLPKLKRLCRFWDLASTKVSKQNADPDWTAGALLGIDDNNICYIIDIQHMRGTPLEVEQLIVQTAREDSAKYGHVEIRMEEEGGSSGKIVTDHYSRKVLSGYDFKGVRATGSKEDRAKPFSAYAEKGYVTLIEGLWHNEFLNEVEAFPTEGIHDDIVDACSGAYNQLLGDDTGAFIMSVGFI
jgi:predicted phage terminase large subunit-like protein